MGVYIYIYYVLQMQVLEIYGLSSAGKLVLWMAWMMSLHLLTAPTPITACIYYITGALTG